MMNLIAFIVRLNAAATRGLRSTGRILAALLILMTASHGWRVEAAFDESGVGARAPGMADAFVGVADDANALFYNPAGLSQLRANEVTAQMGRLNLGLDDGSEFQTTYFGYAQPLKSGEKGTIAFGLHQFELSQLYTERTLSLSYGWKPQWQPWSRHGALMTGFTLKQLHREFDATPYSANAINNAGVASDQADPLFDQNGFSTDDLGIDLGGLFRFGGHNRFNVGFALTNVNNPDVSLGGDDDNPPMAGKLGLGYRPKWGVLSAEIRRVKRLESKSDSEFALGGERRFHLGEMGAIEVRGGYAEGSRDYKAITAGMSYLFNRFQFDYSFNIPVGNLSDTSGDHRVAFSYRWGQKDEDLRDNLIRFNDDLIRAFRSDSEAASLVVNRAKDSGLITSSDRRVLEQIMLHIFPADTSAMSDIQDRIITGKNGSKEGLVDWDTLKLLIAKDADGAFSERLDQGLDSLSVGQPNRMIAETENHLSPEMKRPLIRGVRSLSLAIRAARDFRADDIAGALASVKKLLVQMPEDYVIRNAHDELLSRLNTSTPEAPQALWAPRPVVVSTIVIEGASEFDSKLKSFTESLGYYLNRKKENASLEERQHLLTQLLELYAESGIDLSLVKSEMAEVVQALRQEKVKETLKELQEEMATPAPETIEPAVTPTPVKKPVQEIRKEPVKKKQVITPVPAPKPAVKKPAPAAKAPAVKKIVIPAASLTSFDRSWSFYQAMVKRGLTDPERLEVLSTIQEKFGSSAPAKLKVEIERINNRLQ